MKDFICKYQIQLGKRVEFVPGWDCHGLPIELKASSSVAESDPISIRTCALEFAQKTIENQKSAFRRWGVTCDWNHPYLTCDMDYVEQELRSFYHLYRNGLVYRDRLPVFWSLCHKTALAEAELEYNHQHKSTACYVKFPIQSNSSPEKLSALIWTSTPWTLLSNQAIGFSPSIKYSIVKHGDERFLIASNLFDAISKVFENRISFVEEFDTNRFRTFKYSHPFKSGDLRFIECPFVSDEKGTGLVHLAPNHGRDDFVACLRNRVTPEELFVDENGCFKPNAGSRLESKHVLTSGNEEMLSMFGDLILKQEELIHSYPYDWRSKKPVIVRSSQQWFFNIQDLKEECLKKMKNVKFVPQILSKQLERSLLERPYWCISRQRSWGLPIPVFYKCDDEEGKDPILDESILESLICAFKRNGIDSWWTSSVSDLIPNDPRGNQDLVKSTDILDIWFDSGVSWLPVLPSNEEGKKVADVYLEGMDQFNGWFLSSLITSTAIQEVVPFKSIFVHGFVLDSEGKKMSKSLGNVIHPVDIVDGNKKTQIDPFGADALRFWVLRDANSHRDVRFDLKEMPSCKEYVFRIRKLFRFAIGSLDGFDQGQCLNHNQLLLTEKMILHLVSCFHKELTEAMDEFKFERVFRPIQTIIEQLSGFYITSCKNRLYCSPRESTERKSVQTVLFHVLRLLIQELSFVAPHLCQDTYNHVSRLGIFPTFVKSTVFEVEYFSPPEHWVNEELMKTFQVISSVRDQVNKSHPSKRSNLNLNLSTGSQELRLLQAIQAERCEVDQLADILDLSQVHLKELTMDDLVQFKATEQLQEAEEENGPKMKLVFSETRHSLCLRCRRYTANEEKLCDRCRNCVNNIIN